MLTDGTCSTACYIPEFFLIYKPMIQSFDMLLKRRVLTSPNNLANSRVMLCHRNSSEPSPPSGNRYRTTTKKHLQIVGWPNLAPLLLLVLEAGLIGSIWILTTQNNGRNRGTTCNNLVQQMQNTSTKEKQSQSQQKKH